MIAKIIRFIFLMSFFGSACCLGALFFILNHQWIDLSALEHYDPGSPSIVLDDAGNEFMRFQFDRRKPIALSQMPSHLINAFIAAEDWDFFNHYGISYKGIIRSSLVNLYHGKIVQGASTITQQLVKLLFFDANKTFSRKLKEQLCSVLVERQFTKQQILETYLNHIYFGCGIYGVEAACQRFWNKSAADISVDQAAMLAAIVRSPGRYCPLLCPLSGLQRRNVVLNSMYKLKLIDKDIYEQACAAPLSLHEQESNACAPHIKEMLRVFLENLVGKEALYRDGLIIQTTINSKMQHYAEASFKQQHARMSESLAPDIEGALITIDVHTGGIKALVGGSDFNTSQFNRAMQARRQIGSIIKPLLYAQALQEGFSFADTEIDEPLVLAQGTSEWRPRNWDLKFRGPITLAYALSYSNNIVSIKTLLKIGVDKLIDLAKKCHIQGPFHPYPSLALGALDVTPYEAVGMFNVFANDGVYVQPHYIQWIKDKWGTKIWKHEAVVERVLPTDVTGKVAKVLQLGLKRVHKHFRSTWIDTQAISKTGTTNDARTCWFVASTPEYTTAVYVGYDDNRAMGNQVYPLRTAFPIWLHTQNKIKSVRTTFAYDPSLQEVTVNQFNGMLAHARQQDAISIYV
ncbi:MAG TPA: transglycosylase domain-containing protein [Candidatus Dependentiae bacterium]|nr:transglycosylase domain-containing protein [Candidatus Dependentiae bacterium]HRQ62748.1 transglycosylase domain-containing protein [Candidatus Dependentiae bacterium]